MLQEWVSNPSNGCLLASAAPLVVAAQVQALQACMQAVEQHLASQQLSVDQDCHAARAALQAVTARLQLELGSAGNIWLEEGRPTDAWVQSCQELVCSSRLGPQVGQASSAPRDQWKVWWMMRSMAMGWGPPIQHTAFNLSNSQDNVAWAPDIPQHQPSCSGNRIQSRGFEQRIASMHCRNARHAY